MVERRLGRGLDFFLSSSADAKRGETPAEAPAPETSLRVDQLIPNPYQPRKDFDESELQTLVNSIKSSGILQPILCRKVGERYQIVAGERRWRAAKKAGLEEVPVVLREIDDSESAVFALVENLQRSNLNPIEKAEAFRHLHQEAGGTQEELSKKVGLDRSTVANLMRLLELPPDVRGHVASARLSMGHARAILALPDSSDRSALAAEVIQAEWSVRQTEAEVRQRNEGSGAKPADSAKPQPKGAHEKDSDGKPMWLRELEGDLQQALDAKVAVRFGARKSKISIECRGRDEFERVTALLKSLRA